MALLKSTNTVSELLGYEQVTTKLVPDNVEGLQLRSQTFAEGRSIFWPKENQLSNNLFRFPSSSDYQIIDSYSPVQEAWRAIPGLSSAAEASSHVFPLAPRLPP